MKRAVMRFYLVLTNNAYIDGVDFSYYDKIIAGIL